jgi:hypothetical protein
MELTFEQHANMSRERCRARGLADCIHYAPDWQRRADALFASANATGAPWWDGAVVGLLHDGRMAVVGVTVGVAEEARL